MKFSLTTGMSTHDMIVAARAWLAKQGASTPRDTLTQIFDMCVYLLKPLNPPSNIPGMGPVVMSQQQLLAFGDAWLAMQGNSTETQFLTDLRDGALMYRNGLPLPVPVPTPAPPPAPEPVPPTPVPGPVPPPPPSGPQIRASMFVDAAGCPLSSAINSGVSGPLAWAQSHGQAQENAYRTWLLNALQAAGSDTLVYIVDGYLGDPQTSVLAMCLSDMGHPQDGHHADQTEGWHDRCIAKGVTRQIAILRDSPDTKVPATKDSVARLVAYYKNSRFDVIYLTGLECNRNRTVAQTVQDVKWLQELAPGKRILAGSADPDYLLQVAAGAPGVELWLEQPTSLMSQPLTNASIPTYLASLDRLAAKVGASKTWAGEWWMTSKTDRQSFTKQVLAKGYNCGGGFNA